MKPKRSVSVTFLITLFVISMVVSVGFTGSALAAEKVIKWQCQALNPVGSTSYKRYEALLQDLSKLTGGRLQIKLYSGGALVPNKEIFNAVQKGMLQMGLTWPGYNRDLIPLNNVASGLPLNFKDVWECVYFYKVLGFEEMMDKEYAKHGLFQASTKVMPTLIVTKKPIRKFEDFKGVKLRSTGVLQNYLNKIGSAASYLPSTELYTGLATGVVEGAHYGGYRGAFDLSLYELAKYQFPVPLNVASGDMWLINKKAMAELPQDIQDMMPGFFKAYFYFATNQYQWTEAETKGRVEKELGVKHEPFPAADFKKMQDAAQEIWEEAASKSPECAKAVQMIRDFHKSLHR